MKQFLFGLGIILFPLGCSLGWTKEDALQYYRSIVEEGIPNRKAQRILSDDILLYMKGVIETPDRQTDPQIIQSFIERNDSLVEKLRQARASVLTKAEFNGENPLQNKAIEVSDGLIDLHSVSYAELLTRMVDGHLDLDDLAHFKHFQNDYEQFLNLYRDWKSVRNDFCKKYHITREDVQEIVE